MAVGRYAQVHEQTGFVVNVILWDPVANPEIVPPAGYHFVEDVDGIAGAGCAYDGTTFVHAPPPTTAAEVETKA